MTKGTALVDQLMAALSQITTENGYHTNAGLNILRSRVERADPKAYPYIAVSTRNNTNAAVKPNKVKKDREIEVAGIIKADATDYEPDLDALDEDITTVLASLTDPDNLKGVMEVSVAEGDYLHPEPGSNLAGVIQTITFSYARTTTQNP